MPIHTNPFRLYSSRVCLNHGILVDILRQSQVFWRSYKHLLEINGKRKSDVKDFEVIMKKMGEEPRRKSRRWQHKKKATIEKDFDQSFADLKAMFSSMDRIILDDETFMFRTMKELQKMYMSVYKKFPKIPHIPDHVTHDTLVGLRGIMTHMTHVQHHAWIMSKAHSREFVRVEDISILSNFAERRHIRQHTLELDHSRNRIEPLKVYLRNMRKNNDMHEYHEKLHEVLHEYHEEVQDLSEMLHEGEVLLHRTEKLFKGIEKEVEALELHSLHSKVKKVAHLFHDKLGQIVNMSRREYMHMDKLLKALPKPPKIHESHEEHSAVHEHAGQDHEHESNKK